MGQLGLGHRYADARDQTKKHVLVAPKTCSFNIIISQVSCGEDFTFLLTSKGLLYAMGSNQYNKLGISVDQTKDCPLNYNTPKLVDSLS